MKKIIFLRHGESVANANGVFAGHLDVDLTVTGRMQAVLAALEVKHETIDIIYSSPLRRARHTADYIAQHTGVKLLTHPDLIERRLGKLEGLPFSAQALEAIDHRAVELKAETLEELHDRASKVLNWLDASKHKNIVVVSHGAFGRMLSTVLDGHAWAEFSRSELIPNARPLEFEL